MEKDRFSILPRLDLASLYKKEGNRIEAKKLLYDVLDIDPKNEIALVTLLKNYTEEGDKEKSLEICGKLFRYSNNPRALTNIGILFSFYQWDEEAIKSLSKAIRSNQTSTDAYWELGRVYIKGKEFEKARAIWEEGFKIDPEDMRFKQALGRYKKP